MQTMTEKVLLTSLLIALQLSAAAQGPGLREVENNAFTTSEILEYRIHYGLINAGVARLEIMPEIKKFGKRQVYHVVGTGRTTGAFDWFFKVRDRYESYVDRHSIIPWYFVRRINEGGYKKNQNVKFNHFKNIAISEEATIKVPHGIQDVISVYYFCRTMNFDTADVGDIFPMHTYLDDEVINLNLKYIGRENVKVKAGTFRCLKFRPVLLVGRVFKEEDDMTIWVTDDANKVVIRAQAEVLVGSIKMDLKNYSGLANPLLAKVK